MKLLPLLLFSSATISICALQVANGEEWVVQERHGRFELYSQFEVVPRVLWDELNEVAEEVEELLQVKPASDPVRIVLFTDQQSYVASLGASLPQVRMRKAIFVRTGDVSRVYAYQSRTLTRDLRHEVTHALLHQHLPFLPLWLDEGLAEYLEETKPLRHTSSRASMVRWKARIGWKPELKSMEAIPSAEEMEPVDYRDSWAWVCFLLNESSQTRDLLVTYVNTIHKGGDPGPFSAFSAAITPHLEQRATAYFRRIPSRSLGMSR